VLHFKKPATNKEKIIILIKRNKRLYTKENLKKMKKWHTFNVSCNNKCGKKKDHNTKKLKNFNHIFLPLHVKNRK
jgi:hypothetical protein